MPTWRAILNPREGFVQPIQSLVNDQAEPWPVIGNPPPPKLRQLALPRSAQRFTRKLKHLIRWVLEESFALELLCNACKTQEAISFTTCASNTTRTQRRAKVT